MAVWDRLQSLVFGAAIGRAGGEAITPVLEPVRQHAWRQNQLRVLDPGTVARLVAQALISLGEAEGEAAASGFNGNRVEALVQLAQVAPPIAETLELWRRGKIGEADVVHALNKAQIEPRYHTAILELFQSRLDAPVIALAIVRGIMHDPGFLPVAPPSSSGKVAAFPVSPLDAIEEAKATGIDRDRLFVETAIAGRPMGPEAAAAAVFRNILEKVDFDRAIAEGDVRNEWAEAIFDTARQIPSVSDYVNAHLRGWIDEAAMNEGVARHGMSPADAHLLYLRTGRPAAPGQMATAAARGIAGPDGGPMDEAQFLKGIAQSDIRPEWGPMLWQSRFLYPPLFQISRLVQAGAITADTAAEWARKDRYPPEVVDALHAYWSKPGTAGASSPATKAQTQLWSATHASFIAGESDEATAAGHLDAAGVPAGQQGQVLALWAAEKELRRKTLTPAQIHKAYVKSAPNPASGGNWTRAEAVDALVSRGYSVDDANAYLDIP